MLMLTAFTPGHVHVVRSFPALCSWRLGGPRRVSNLSIKSKHAGACHESDAFVLSHLRAQVLKNAYEPALLGRLDGIVTLPDDVLELISVVEAAVGSPGPA